MGGQFNYWGFWLDCEYGIGQSSETCTTFKDYNQLSKRKDFRIRNLEVWGIGDEPKQNDDSDEEVEVRQIQNIFNCCIIFHQNSYRVRRRNVLY